MTEGGGVLASACCNGRSRQSTPKVAALKYPAIAAMDGRCEGAESTAIRS